MKKYEFTGETKNIDGHILYRIRALRNIHCGGLRIRAGDLGGWIETEENLSQEGNCWVYGNARVYGNAEVYRTRDIFWIDCIGSRNDTTTFFRTQSKQIHVKCGCFSGTIDEFETTVRTTHGDNMHAKMYRLAIQMAKLKLGGD